MLFAPSDLICGKQAKGWHWHDAFQFIELAVDERKSTTYRFGFLDKLLGNHRGAYRWSFSDSEKCLLAVPF